MRQNYGTQLTRDYLEYLGITDVSRDGTKILKGDKELAQHFDGRYNLVSLYDPAKRLLIPVEERTNTSGQFHVGVQRIVYCWYNRIIPEGMVIDHINSDKLDNRLENLRLYTPKENLAKERPESTRELKCKLNKPRAYYEDKLAQYEALYEAAKKEHNAEEAHKQRTNIAQTKARLRYYDNHIHEVDKIKAETKQKENKQMTEFKKDLMELKYWKERFKEAGNKIMWHECCKVEKLAKTTNRKEATFILQHALDTLHGKFGGMQ